MMNFTTFYEIIFKMKLIFRLNKELNFTYSNILKDEIVFSKIIFLK